jgi:hypothetical protein
MAMGAFGAIGYWLHGVQGRQNELIAHKKAQIISNRERLLAQREEKGGDEE